VEGEPFLLYESSRAFLDGDRRAIQARFAPRRDALDYLAMVGVLAGGLLVGVTVAQIARTRGTAEAGEAVSGLVVGGLVVIVAGYFVSRRRSAATAAVQLIREGQVLPGMLVACEGQEQTASEASLGETARAYAVTVDHRFTTPMGKEITDTAAHNRRDLRHTELPAPGTPLRVLYLDDQNYALL
jgi:hypothetical protein